MRFASVWCGRGPDLKGHDPVSLSTASLGSPWAC